MQHRSAMLAMAEDEHSSGDDHQQWKDDIGIDAELLSQKDQSKPNQYDP